MNEPEEKFEAMLKAASEVGDLPVDPSEEAGMRQLWQELGGAQTFAGPQRTGVSFEELTRFHAIMHPEKPATQTGGGRKFGLWGTSIAVAVALLALFIQSFQVKGRFGEMETEMNALRSALVVASLDSPSAAERLEGLLACRGLEQPSVPLVEAVLARLQSDPNVNVRLASARVLAVMDAPAYAVDSLESAALNENSLLVALEIIELVRALEPQRAERLWQAVDREERPGWSSMSGDSSGEVKL